MSVAARPLKKHEALQDEAFRGLANKVATAYESDEFTIGIVTNQSLKSRGGSKIFQADVPVANHVVIRADQPVTIRFNATTEDPITIDPGIPFENANWLEVTDIFLTTTEASNGIRVIVS